MRNDERKLISIAYHRNGVSGAGFHVILFQWKDPDRKQPRDMVATVFEERGHCAIYDVPELAAGNIAFAEGNSWRGDDFEADMRKWIQRKYTHDIATGPPQAARS